MDTKDIRGFIRSFELRSINKAAGDLFISPQGLGKAINRLEAELGVKLFDRTPNGLVPTESGVYLYKKEHSLIAWLPYYNKYLIGKQVNKEKEGIFLMVIEILGTLCFYLSLNVQLGSFDTIIFILFIVCCLISFSMNIYLLHKIMKQTVLKYADWITIFNVLTLGFFRGISLFLIRNKS